LLRRFAGCDKAVMRPDGKVAALRREIPADAKAAQDSSSPDSANPPVSRQMRPAGAAGPAGSAVHMVEIATGKELNILRAADPKHSFLGPVGWSADGKILATAASTDSLALSLLAWQRVDLWDVGVGKVLRSYEGNRVLCSADVQTIAVAT